MKLAFIAVAMTLAVSLVNQCKRLPAKHRVPENGPLGPWFPASTRLRAAGILLAWFGVIAAGRLLAYTYSILTVT